eukprot:11674958-Alexandrium_andersonii.AAC.1
MAGRAGSNSPAASDTWSLGQASASRARAGHSRRCSPSRPQHAGLQSGRKRSLQACSAAEGGSREPHSEE